MSADRVVSSSSSHIIGEGATLFTDMMDTMLKVLDRRMALTLATGQFKPQMTSCAKDSYPDWFLQVQGNDKISEVSYRYSDSLSLDNNPMVLVKLKDLAH